MQLTIERLREFDGRVRQLATYQADPALRDSWTSYAADVRAGRRFAGDCDDWASTVLHLLADAGAPRDRLWRALVSSTGEAIDHMIGIALLDDGTCWTVGDTFGPPARVAGDRAGPHKVIQTSRLDEKLRWRLFKPQRLQRETNARSMRMRTSEAGRDFIRSHEQFVGHAYDDFRPRYRLRPGDEVLGTLTWGYGHTGPDVEIGKTISEPAARALFDKDLERFERAVRRLVRVDLQQHQFDALVSFTFNVGEASLSRSTLLRKINAGAPDHEIQTQFRRWTRSKGKVLKGLVRRREAEAAMWAGEVVTHGAIKPSTRAPDISPVPLVEEDRSAVKSKDVWLAGGGAATGGVTLWTAIQDAVRDFRDTLYDTDMQLLLSLCGVVMAAIGAVLLYKRLKEIREAKR